MITFTKAMAVVILLAVAVANAIFVIEFKASMDRNAAICLAAERALRKGSLHVDELSFVPFGFGAWHLYPYYISHEGKQSAQIDGFSCYVRPDSVQIGSNYSRSLRRFRDFNRVAPTDLRGLIGVQHVRFLWLYDAEYYLLPYKSAAETRANCQLGPDYERINFPLSEREWKELIAP